MIASSFLQASLETLGHPGCLNHIGLLQKVAVDFEEGNALKHEWGQGVPRIREHLFALTEEAIHIVTGSHHKACINAVFIDSTFLNLLVARSGNTEKLFSSCLQLALPGRLKGSSKPSWPKAALGSQASDKACAARVHRILDTSVLTAAVCQVWDIYEGLNMCNMSYYYSHVTALDSWVH